MPKILGFCVLHYGIPYLAAAVEALYNQVDAIVILYTASPSQGFQTAFICPDTQEELMEAVKPFKDKIIWHEGTWQYEGEHVEAIRQFQEGYDWLVRFDSDEIYPEGSVNRLIEQAVHLEAQIFRVPFLHFWRSFGKVCRDGQMPDRIRRVRGGNGFAYLDDGYLLGQPEINRVFHMGYAQPSEYIKYKMQVQAHRPEWRGGWFEHTWLLNKQTDVHPVIFDFWNVESFDKNLLPEVLKKHSYFSVEVID